MPNRESAAESTRANRLRALFVVLAVASASLVVGGTGFLNPIEQDVDSQADWLMARALVDGADPYTDLELLATQYDVGYRPNVPPGHTGEAIHPRTPGAILLSLPLLLVDYNQLQFTFGLAGLLLMALAIYLAGRRDLAPWLLGVAIYLVIVSRPSLWSFRYGTQAPILAVTGALMLRLRDEDDKWAGLALGIAITLKAFPALLLFPLARAGRWRSFRTAIGTTIVLNVAGLLAPGVTISGAFHALRSATQTWYDAPSNLAIASRLSDWFGLPNISIPVLFLGMAVTAWWVGRTHAPLGSQLAVVASAAILLSPLAWNHYILFVAPLLLPIIATNPTPRLIVVLAALLVLFGPPRVELWVETLGVLTVMAIALVPPSFSAWNMPNWRAASVGPHPEPDPSAGSIRRR